MKDQLTRAQMNRQDLVDNAILYMLESILPDCKIEYNSATFAKIRITVQDVVVNNMGLMTEMDFYPYWEEES